MATQKDICRQRIFSVHEKAGMASFARQLVPEDAYINFIYREDFDGDRIAEAVIGYTSTEQDSFIQRFTVIYISQVGQFFNHGEVLTTVDSDEFYGFFDGAYVADTNGDGLPELVVALAAGNAHFVDGYVFHWQNGVPLLAWRTTESFAHGRLEVVDYDADGVFEILLQGAVGYGEEILSYSEAGPHIRESYLCKWNGGHYNFFPCPVPKPCIFYNTAVEFLMSVWKEDYKAAYKLALLPGFLGLEGLSGDELEIFADYTACNIRPALVKNLEHGTLIPQESFDWVWCFSGTIDDFVMELVDYQGEVRIKSLTLYPKAT